MEYVFDITIARTSAILRIVYGPSFGFFALEFINMHSVGVRPAILHTCKPPSAALRILLISGVLFSRVFDAIPFRVVWGVSVLNVCPEPHACNVSFSRYRCRSILFFALFRAVFFPSGHLTLCPALPRPPDTCHFG